VFSLFGSKAHLSLTVDGSQFLPGDVVKAHLEVKIDKDIDVRGATISLVRANRYQYRYTSTNSEGDDTTASRWKTDEVPAASLPIGEPGKWPKGEISRDFELAVPADALGSSAGQITGISWLVRARLDISGRDASTESPIRVLAVKHRFASWGDGEVSTSGVDDCALEFINLSTSLLRPGESIRGGLRLTPTKSFKAGEIHAELARLERVPQGEGNRRLTPLVTGSLGRDVQLTAGEPQELAFELTLPADASPTFAAPQSNLHWLLRGVVHRGMLHHDPTISKEVVVFNAGAAEDVGDKENPAA